MEFLFLLDPHSRLRTYFNTCGTLALFHLKFTFILLSGSSVSGGYLLIVYFTLPYSRMFTKHKMSRVTIQFLTLNFKGPRNYFFFSILRFLEWKKGVGHTNIAIKYYEGLTEVSIYIFTNRICKIGLTLSQQVLSQVKCP